LFSGNRVDVVVVAGTDLSFASSLQFSG